MSVVPLPIDSFLPEITRALAAHGALVLVAEPGAGKTTRVPPAVLASGVTGDVVMLQPRRIAARASAERIADENGWTVGGMVGYQVRFDKRVSAVTRLRVVTEGILTRQLLDDPELAGVGCVILDEFHERSIHADLALALLQEVRSALRDDLKILVMSATLDAEPVAKFLGDCPIIRVPGRTFPVDIIHQPAMGEPLEVRVRLAIQKSAVGGRQSAEQHLPSVIADRRPPIAGDVLVFLPGAAEIGWCERELAPLACEHGWAVLPLHGSLPFDEQRRALAPMNRRKIVLATNIAETSLTIDGVTTVIDSGLARVASFDADRGLEKLEVVQISIASATQRAGRAGRTRAGVCVRLWGPRDERQMTPFDAPEIHRSDLAATVLALHAWGLGDARRFGWYDAPSEASLASAERLLTLLGALDDAGHLTELGKAIHRLPVHPRLGRLLTEARRAGDIESGVTVAALLGEKDVLRRTRADRFALGSKNVLADSDLTVRIEALAEAERVGFDPRRADDIDMAAARRVVKVRDDLLRFVDRDRETGNSHRLASSPAKREIKADMEHAGVRLRRLALLAYPDRVCRRRAGDPSAAGMVGGGGVRLDESSAVKTGELFVAIDAQQDDRIGGRQALVRIASAIEPAWLSEFFPQSVIREDIAVLDDAGRVAGLRRVRYLDLLLSEDRTGNVAPEAARKILIETIAPKFAEFAAENEDLRVLLLRLEMLHTQLPKHLRPASWHGQLARDLPMPRQEVEWLEQACHSAKSIDDVRRNLVRVVADNLVYEDQRALDQHAPETLVVPTGNRLKLDWSASTVDPLRGPVLAVRLQELFGLPETPRLVGGRVPVILHLLGPNYRPVQVTEDLASFWKNLYLLVRKDLRARYPKHSWPDDPLTAPPQAKGRPTKG